MLSAAVHQSQTAVCHGPSLSFMYSDSSTAVADAPVSTLKHEGCPFTIRVSFHEDFWGLCTVPNYAASGSVSMAWTVLADLHATAKCPFLWHSLHSTSFAGHSFHGCCGVFPHFPHALALFEGDCWAWALCCFVFFLKLFFLDLLYAIASMWAGESGAHSTACYFFLSSCCLTCVMAVARSNFGFNWSFSNSLASRIPTTILSRIISSRKTP